MLFQYSTVLPPPYQYVSTVYFTSRTSFGLSSTSNWTVSFSGRVKGVLIADKAK